MTRKHMWITLPKVGNYCLRPMRTERSGSAEMKRRLAVKNGYYAASQYIYANKNPEENQDWLDQLRSPPEHYTAELCAYFHEGFALGLDIADFMKHPFGELKCNGGSPMLPVMGGEVPD